MKQLNSDITDIYNRYSKYLYSIAYRILNDSLEAEDVMQETIIEYYKSSPIIIRSKESYLKSICIRKCIDIVRRRKVKESFIAESTILKENFNDSKENWDEFLEDKKRGGEIERTIENIKQTLQILPDGYRVVLSLYLFEGYDYKEISKILQTKQSSVRSQYMRGKEKLLKLLKEKS